MPKTDAPQSFAELIEQAQKATNIVTDVSSPFPFPHNNERVVNLDEEDPIKVPGMTKLDYEAHVKCLYLPKDIVEYQNTLNEILNAHAILRYEDRHFTKEGDCVVVVCYLTYKPVPKNKKDDNKENRDGNEEDRDEDEDEGDHHN